MKVVIDASAAFTFLTVPQRVRNALSEARDVAAPELIVPEMINARWKLNRAGIAAPAFASILGLFERIRLVSNLSLASRADALAQRLDHPAYDCFYAVLAEQEQARFITADRRFANKLERTSIEVMTV